jgi:hypothetical protein
VLTLACVDRHQLLDAMKRIRRALRPGGRSFVSGLAADSCGATYLVRSIYYGRSAYVSKVDESGHLWTVRIGGALSETSGSYHDEATAVATDASGNVYVVGRTSSPDFPTLNAIQTQLRGGSDAFLTKLSPEGKILYSTYLGGSGGEWATQVALDAAANVYATGDDLIQFCSKFSLQ